MQGTYRKHDIFKYFNYFKLKIHRDMFPSKGVSDTPIGNTHVY